MRVFLNEWSLTSANGVFANWSRIKAFDELVDELTQKCTLEILAPSNLWQLPLAGCNVAMSVVSHPDDKGLTADMLMYLRRIYKKMCPMTTGYPLFSEKDDMSNPSSSVGRAASYVVPARSFCLDSNYEKDKIEGWLQEEGKVATKSSVVNIFKKKTENYMHLADLTEGRHKNPLETPLWNTALVSELLKGVDFVKVDSKDRQGLLITYGRIVAEMNGWSYDQNISKLNQNSGQLRFIFSSDNFVDYAPAYLSLDMEGPDLAFELCDKRGNHKGEYSWNGTHKEAKARHGIRVK